MNKIDIKPMSISDVFKNFYVIPDYQREYVWEEKQVHQLLEDISEEHSHHSDSEYFIGSIVVCTGGDNGYELIDGQQRLTTLFLCLCSFRKLLTDSEEYVSFINNILFSKTVDKYGKLVQAYRIDLQYEHSSEILKQISEDNISQNNGGASSRRIADSYVYITQFLERNFREKDNLTAMLGFFLNNVILVQIEAPKISDALKIFETINERGVGLNPMDLMKNLMFRQVEQERFDKLKTEWKKITDTLEKSKEKPLRFLRYFIMANYNVRNVKGEEIIREDEIYEWITKKENVQQCNYEEKPFEFVKFMQANAEAYAMFLNGKDKEGNDNVYLDNIQRLSGSFRQHLMLLLAAKDLDKELFVHLARQIEALIIHYIVTREPTREFERKFSRWAKEIKKINNKESLNAFIENTLRPEVQSKAKDFENAMLQFDSFTLQQYRLRYILAKLMQYVDQQVLGSYEDTNLVGYITKGIEIEHILPQTPKLELREAFGEEYDEYKIKLGNLTLLEKPMNIVASNDFFDNKKPIYKTSKFYLTKSIAQLDTVGVNSSVSRINQSLKSFDKWDKGSIIERQHILLELAKRIWRIEAIS